MTNIPQSSSCFLFACLLESNQIRTVIVSAAVPVPAQKAVVQRAALNKSLGQYPYYCPSMVDSEPWRKKSPTQMERGIFCAEMLRRIDERLSVWSRWASSRHASRLTQ